MNSKERVIASITENKFDGLQAINTGGMNCE